MFQAKWLRPGAVIPVTPEVHMDLMSEIHRLNKVEEKYIQLRSEIIRRTEEAEKQTKAIEKQTSLGHVHD